MRVWLVSLALVVPACSSVDSELRTSSAADLGAYRTFAFSGSGDPAIRGAIQEQLRQRGIVLAGDQPPDFLVRERLRTVEPLNAGPRRLYGDIYAPLTRLEIELVDSNTGQVFWRGAADLDRKAPAKTVSSIMQQAPAQLAATPRLVL